MRILTFDLEEWFHLLDHDATRTEQEWVRFPSRIQENTHRILGLLDQYQLKATFFCLGWIAETYPEVIRQIHREGHEIGCHSHRHQLLHQQTPLEFRQDLSRAVKTLEDLVGAKVRAFRAPGFSLIPATLWAMEALAEQGIEVDSSVFPGHHAHGGFSGVPGGAPTAPVVLQHHGVRIREFPINSIRLAGRPLVFSGGGYFRIFPYRALRPLVSRSPYLMTYFHPRDFDAGQPVLWDLPWKRLFRSYYGINTCFQKLERLLREFPFTSLGASEAAVDWSRAPVISL